MTVAGKWRFRKFVAGKPVLADIAPAPIAEADAKDFAKGAATLAAGITAALDAADAEVPKSRDAVG
jgi:hypothetical protein